MNRFLSSLNPKYMYTSRSFFTLNLIINLIACLCIITLSSCDKDPYQDGTPELPPITMEGKNTLGFLLDGKVWVPYQESSGPFNPTIDFGIDGTVFIGGARLIRDNDINQKISISIDLKDGEKRYPINIESNIFYFINNKNIGWKCNEYLNNSNESFLNITKLDWTDKIIAGTFEFPMMVSGCQDTVSITEGRFDLKF